MDGLIYGACALVTATSAAIRLHYTRKRRQQTAYPVARRARMSAFAACFIGSLLAIPTVAEAIDRLTTLNEVSTLASDLAALLFWTSLQVMVADWRHIGTHHLGIAIRIIAVSCIALLLVWQYHLADTARVDLSTAYARNDDVAVYLLAYLSYSAVAALEIGAFSTSMAFVTWRDHPAASTGLSIAAVGGICGLAYACSRGGYLIAYRTGHAWPLAVENTISPALAGLSIICVATGLAMATICYNLPLRNPHPGASSRV
ncbi:hypothetical protein AMK26_02770 [Streptomyces sp. CB03234]|nr:hypothetical protein AMK26_02770 [Streptomyces sp. CB03234]